MEIITYIKVSDALKHKSFETGLFLVRVIIPVMIKIKKIIANAKIIKTGDLSLSDKFENKIKVANKSGEIKKIIIFFILMIISWHRI